MWKPILGYENHFEISDGGIIRRLSNLKILKPHVTNRGYLRIALCVNKVSKKYTVHRLVALSFIPNPKNKEYVNHIDGDKLNNCVNNLEWATHNENETHAFNNNLKQRKTVVQYDMNNNKLNEFTSAYAASLSTKIARSSIFECCNGKLNTAGNYIWKFNL